MEENTKWFRRHRNLVRSLKPFKFRLLASNMEKIVNNQGLQHLAEKVFWNLDVENLKKCTQINHSCKQILQNPLFCLNKFNDLSKDNQNE